MVMTNRMLQDMMIIFISLSLVIIHCRAVPFKEDDESLPNPVHGKRVLIMTRYRSGSSFLGNLFGHHPNVFYVPEPLQLVSHLDWNNPAKVIWQNQTAFKIDPLYNCDFSGIYKNSLKDPKHVDIWRRVFCFRKNYTLPNRNINHRRICRKNNEFADTKGYLPWFTSKVCRDFENVVIKAIRLTNMKIIKHLIEDLKVKIVHNIRDPRGQISSILALENKKMSMGRVRTLARGICNDHKKALDTTEHIFKETPSLGRNYVLVRYEDIAYNPERMTRVLYKFTGLDYHNDVKEWIGLSTKKTKHNPYGVIRDSKATALAWMHKLSLEQVKAIQESCQEVLRRLGYALIQSEEDLETKQVRKNPKDPFIREYYLGPKP